MGSDVADLALIIGQGRPSETARRSDRILWAVLVVLMSGILEQVEEDQRTKPQRYITFGPGDSYTTEKFLDE